MDLDSQTFWAFYNAGCTTKQANRTHQGRTMANTKPDTRDKKLRDLLTIRDYLRDRRDELHEQGWHGNAKQIGDEVSRLDILIAEAEAEA